MLISRKCMLTGKMRVLDLDITPEEIVDWEEGTLVQDAFPRLTPEEREFFMTGIWGDDWPWADSGVEE